MAKGKKRREKKNITEGNIYIQATFNNTIVTITDLKGNVFAWASAGGLGFKGAKKSTPFAAQMTTESAIHKAKDYNLQYINVMVKGPGMGRESAIRSITNTGIIIRSIKDITPIAHNGCRPQKIRKP